MSQFQKKPDPLVAYPYHLPDKPVPTGSYVTDEEFYSKQILKKRSITHFEPGRFVMA
ncbi:MAG: hypothetical protein J0I20_32995 [Chloroflexi bacterium]|nr:hypothetical protein [Chloroflexota bacterium]